MIDAFLYGLILAFGLILPLGIQNIFVFNQGAMQKQVVHAFPSAITAFVCDAILILLSILGVSVAVLEIPWLKNLILIFGFFFLEYMAWVTWFSKPTVNQSEEKCLSAKQQIAFAVSVSLLNPHALIDTIGVIGPSSLEFTGSEKWAFTAACLLVSLSWFLGLSITGHFVRRLDKTGTWLMVVNKISAVIMFGIGLSIGWMILKG